MIFFLTYAVNRCKYVGLITVRAKRSMWGQDTAHLLFAKKKMKILPLHVETSVIIVQGVAITVLFLLFL